MYKEERKSIFSSFIVPKGSPWKEPFSQEILNIFESKRMEKLLNKWLWYAKCEKTENDVNSFPWKYFGGLFVVTTGSCVFSIILLCVENIIDRCWERENEWDLTFCIHIQVSYYACDMLNISFWQYFENYSLVRVFTNNSNWLKNLNNC